MRDLDPAATDLEGYLFPDTYDLPQSPEAPRALVRRMAAALPRGDRPRARAHRREGAHACAQVVTLASIVELETARRRRAAPHRRRVPEPARSRGCRSRPTPRSSTRSSRPGRWDGNIRKRDLEIDSPYNTYRRPGLPPGPLGSPGREAILAVLEPAETKELYFVSRNDGTHEFSETLVEHNRAVDRYQRRRASS